jgi:predicted TIM-barrel fold metal-dependent hydrolase
MKIDIFNHFLPASYLAALSEQPGPHQPIVRYAKTIRALWEVEERLRMIEPNRDLLQIVTLGQPTPELVGNPNLSPKLAQLCNDGMAEIRDRWPEIFPAFVASLPMDNIPAALDELDRAVEKLGACGIQVLTNINGRPLDTPEFFPIFERVTNYYGLPIWMHPYRPPTIPDYPVEARSEYEIYAVLSWPHETSVAMARIVFSEMFDRLPNLRVITHHCGATIPFLAGRVGPMWDELGLREQSASQIAIRKRMAERGKRPIDYFREFYVDTVVGGSLSSLRCGLDFYGADHVVFGTDFPYGPEAGMLFLRENLRAVAEFDMPAADRDRINFGNARLLLRKNPQNAAANSSVTVPKL